MPLKDRFVALDHVSKEAMSAFCRQCLMCIIGCSLEFSSRNVEDMISKIRRLLEGEHTRRQLKARALQRAEDFSWEKCAKETYVALVEWPKG